MPVTDLSVIIPLRNRMGGKTRLADRFSPEAREHLVRSMAEIVLDAVLGADIASQVIVVTTDPVFVQEVIGDRTGVRIVHQPSRFAGLGGALERGRDAAMSTSTLVLFADLPALTADDLRDVSSSQSNVVLLPDRYQIGTNGVLVRNDPDGEFRYQFGEQSFARHLQEVRNLNWSVEIVENSGTSRDLDTLQDWNELPESIQRQLAGEWVDSGRIAHGKVPL